MNRRAARAMAASVVALLAVAPLVARTQPDDAPIAAHPLACVDAIAVDGEHSALDVAAGAHDCVGQQRYEVAAELMVASMAYAFFDTRRVRDASAHGAIQAMMATATSNTAPVVADALMSAMDALEGDIGRKTRVCDHLKRIGPPSYSPTYMVERGQEKSVAPHGDALVEGFDAGSAWTQALTFVKCAG